MLVLISREDLFAALAAGVLLVHALFLLWVAAGALFTKSRSGLRWAHIASLVWSIFSEVLPWPCPLTILENWLESQAGVQPYQGGFLLHYLDALVYPDIPGTVLTAGGLAVCLSNLVIYVRRYWKAGRCHD